MSRKLLMVSLFVIVITILLSCSGNSAGTAYQSPASTSVQPEPADVIKPDSIDESDVVLSVGKSTLSPEETTQVTLQVKSDKDYSIQVNAVYGSIENDGESIQYSSPAEIPPGYVDTITAHIEQDGKQVEKQANILILNSEMAKQWMKTEGPEGGTITYIEADRKSHGVMYAGGSGSRLFKSVDNGASWRGLIIDKGAYNGAFYGIKVSPDDSDIVYTIWNRDLFVTNDAGSTWKNVIQGSVLNIDVNDKCPELLLVTMEDGRALISRDHANTFSEITANLPNERIAYGLIVSESEYWVGTRNGGNGRVYKTIDSGRRWESVNLDYPPDADIHSLYVDPDDSNTIYVTMNNTINAMLGEERAKYFQVTGNDGKTWRQIEIPAADARICVLGIAQDGTLYVSSGGMIFKSGDSGNTWTRIAEGWVNGDPVSIGFDSEDPSHLFLPTNRSGIIESRDGGKTWELTIQGLDNIRISLLATPYIENGQTVYVSSVGGEGIFKTADFGKTWVNVLTNKIHPWGDELQVNPLDPNEIWYIADVGYTYISLDGGKTWELRYDPTRDGTFGHTDNQFCCSSIYSFAAAPDDPDVIYAVKNGFGIFKSRDGGRHSWQFLENSGIDYTYTLAIDPRSSDVVYSGYNPKPFEDYAMVRKTADGGQTWETALRIEGSEGVTSVVIDPSDPDTVYAGSIGDNAGLWVTDDCGENWSRMYEALTFTNIHAMAADPNNPNIAYAGVWGGGTYKTKDKGKSWGRLENDPTDSAIAIMPDSRDENTLYIADRMKPAVYKTTDSGQTWREYFNAGKGYYRVLAAALSDSDPSVMYVSVLESGSPFGGALYRIENGVTKRIGEGIDRTPVSIAVDPGNSNHLLVISHAGGVFESKDGGVSWASLSDKSKGLPDKMSMSFNKAVFDPADSNIVYLLGGADVVTTALTHSGISADSVNTVYRSTDGGRTWANLNDGNLGTNSGSVKGIAFLKGEPGTLLIGCTNGIFQSNNNGAAWESVSGNMPCTNTAGILVSADEKTVYVPMLGEGVYTGDFKKGTIKWQGKSMLRVPIYHVQVAVDPSRSNIIYASAYPGGIFKSTDGGKSFSESNFGLPSFKVEDPLRQGYYAIQISPSNPDILYLGIYGKGMYISKDGAGTWIAINGADGIMALKGIYSLLIDPGDPDIVTVSAEEGVFRTKDAGNTWQPYDSGLPDGVQVKILAEDRNHNILAGTLGYEMYSSSAENAQWKQIKALGNFGVFWTIWNNRPMYQYTTLLFNKNDHDLIFMGTFPAGMYKSIDGGKSWRESNVGWTNDGVFYLTYHPNNDQIIYAGTYNGVNRSNDKGVTWEKIDNGWPSQQWVFSIDFDWNNPDIMYACSKNGENQGQGREDFHGTVMKSTDGGDTWFPITAGLDCTQEFYKILVDRHDPSILYLASQWDGVFISRNSGASWEPWNDGLTNKFSGVNGNNVTNTMILSPDGNIIYFGTSGDGVFRRVTETVAENWR